MGFTNIIALLSGVALFLFGMGLMGDGLKKVAGQKLEVVLYRLTSTPLKGFLLGTGVTAVIQSSSATSVMVVGFVNSGMMKVRQAIGIILGAILGTSITGWVVCLSSLSGTGWMALLSTATLTGVISIIGICLRMFSKSKTHVQVGNILMGFAVLMFGMSAMSSAVSPLREDAFFLDFMTELSHPVLGILFGLLFTAILQSASASVGILQALAATGAISFSAALPLLMGIAIGASIPVLVSAIGANVSGRRTAMVYLVVVTAGAVFCGAGFYAVDAFLHFAFMDTVMTTFTIALLNTIYRFINVVLFVPLIAPLERFVNWLVKDKNPDETEQAAKRLEERFLQHPALAIEQSRITINAMAEESEKNLAEAMLLLDEYSDGRYDEVVKMESTVDRYEDMLGTYLVKLTGRDMSKKQSEEVSKYLHTISDFERISDHALNIAEAAREKKEKGITFSDAGAHEIEVLGKAITEIVHLTISAFISGDLEAAAHVEPLEELIDDLCDELKLHHIDRLQKGDCTIQVGFVFNDLLTNYERVADHCSNIAVAMIELELDSFDTHEYLQSVKDIRSAAFEAYYDEYSKRFSLT